MPSQTARAAHAQRSFEQTPAYDGALDSSRDGFRLVPLAGLNARRAQTVDTCGPQGSAPKTLVCSATEALELALLDECESLASLLETKTDPTSAGVSAVQKALPNRNAGWDGEVKPKVHESAVAGPN